MPLARVLRIAVAVALTVYVVWRADPASIVRIATSATVSWIGYAVALVVIDRALNAVRWVMLLAALSPGSRPSLAPVLRIFFVSSFVGTFLPSLGGDVYRAYQLARLNVRGTEAAISVLMDRVLGVLSMVLVAAAALALVPDVQIPGVVPALIVTVSGCLVAAAGVFSERAARLAATLMARIPSARINRLAEGLIDAVRRYSHHHGTLLSVLWLSIGVQVLRIVQAYCLGRSLSMAEPLSLYFALIPLITLVMQIPITVGGLGTTQYAFERLFGYAGVAPPQAVALSILFLALGTVGNLPGGLIYMIGQRARR